MYARNSANQKRNAKREYAKLRTTQCSTRRMPKSVLIAYLLLLLGGAMGLHRAYLYGIQHAIFYTLTLDFIGIGFINDWMTLLFQVEERNRIDCMGGCVTCMHPLDILASDAFLSFIRVARRYSFFHRAIQLIWLACSFPLRVYSWLLGGQRSQSIVHSKHISIKQHPVAAYHITEEPESSFVSTSSDPWPFVLTDKCVHPTSNRSTDCVFDFSESDAFSDSAESVNSDRARDDAEHAIAELEALEMLGR